METGSVYLMSAFRLRELLLRDGPCLSFDADLDGACLSLDDDLDGACLSLDNDLDGACLSLDDALDGACLSLDTDRCRSGDFRDALL